MSGRPSLRLGLDGVLFVPTRGGGLEPAAYARPFVHWAAANFETAVLTRRGLHASFALLQQLGGPQDLLPVGGFTPAQVARFVRDPLAHWVDACAPDELGLTGPARNRFVQVDPAVGVTEATRRALLAPLRGLR